MRLPDRTRNIIFYILKHVCPTHHVIVTRNKKGEINLHYSESYETIFSVGIRSVIYRKIVVRIERRFIPRRF